MKSKSSAVTVFALTAFLFIGLLLMILFVRSLFVPSHFENVKVGVFRVQKGDSIEILAPKIERDINDSNYKKWKIYVDPRIIGRTSSEDFVGGGNAILLLRVARAYKCKCTVSPEESTFRFIE